MRTMGRRIFLAAATALLVWQAPRHARAADEPDTIMGLYQGSFKPASGAPEKAEGCVIAEGMAKGSPQPSYRAVLSVISADGTKSPRVELRGVLGGKSAPLSGKVKFAAWTGMAGEGKLAAQCDGPGGGKWELARVEPHSPTEGARPPAGAIVLLPYEPGQPTNLNAWSLRTWKLLPDGSVEVAKGSNRTIQAFGDCRLHVEFMTPYEPSGRGQGRGNSGVYLLGRYEVQVLDSFGLPPGKGECGAIYGVAAPKANACYPPLCWQTFDITFRTARLAVDGSLEKPATMTVVQNGVTIHDNQEAALATRARRPGPEIKSGPLLLQDHGHPVRYRNIWLAPLEGGAK